MSWKHPALLCVILAGLAEAGCAKSCPCARQPEAPAAPGSGEGAAGATISGAPDIDPAQAESLPEVTLRNVGLHVGGGSNDETEKEPFKRAVEARFDDFLRCYRSVEEPDKGGTFGVDLYIDRDGGSPEVRQPRTAMKGAEFRACMLSAFSQIDFQRPSTGPTVISYSLRFELRGG